METYLLALLLFAVVVGFIFRIIRIPMEFYIYKWRPLLFISRGFQVLAIVATVIFLPWVAGQFAQKPDIHGGFFLVVTFIGYIIGCRPGKWLYDWLVQRQAKKNHHVVHCRSPQIQG